MLGSTATTREAKAYLSRFDSKKPSSPTGKLDYTRHKDIGVNLGSLYLPVRAVDQNPVFLTSLDQPRFDYDGNQSLHVALVKIRAPQSIKESTLKGIGHTLSQLAQLGLSCVVVPDPQDGRRINASEGSRIAIGEADRIVEVIEAYGGQGARRLDNVVSVCRVDEQALPSVKVKGAVQITNRDLLLAPLRRGMVPVVVPIGFSSNFSRLMSVVADEVLLALTREFAGLQTNVQIKEHSCKAAESITIIQKQISLDRIIVLDPLGGIPSTDKIHGSHIFINLEQEYTSIRNDVLDAGKSSPRDTNALCPPPSSGNLPNAFALSVPPPESLLGKSVSVKGEPAHCKDIAETDFKHTRTDFHVQNLDLIKNTLALLPPSSSAFLTTPDAVASSQNRPTLASQGPMVRTRRQRNPLIHNLLTDKPVVSSSLPSSRLRNSVAQPSTPTIAASPATFFKRGMPVSIVPNPLVQKWVAPLASKPSISLLDPRIDLSRLVHLIDDSFNRKLDVPHYLNRIKDRIAGVIIAGEYEGGAILTWEVPPGVETHKDEQMVPYLDKFAVLKRSQGAGGVADIVFKAMVRECFPNGVCWRSRKNNPVNRWYFERAIGTWKIPKTNWTMFWTTEGVDVGDELFSHYEGVCKTVEPSWADKKHVID